MPEHVPNRSQYDELVLGAGGQPQPAQGDGPGRVSGRRVHLVSLGVQEEHAAGTRRRVEVAVEGDLDRVRGNIHADHPGAVAEASPRTRARVVDQDRLAATMA